MFLSVYVVDCTIENACKYCSEENRGPSTERKSCILGSCSAYTVEKLNMCTNDNRLLIGFRHVKKALLTSVSSPGCWSRQKHTWYSWLEFWPSSMCATVYRPVNVSEACSIPSIVRRVLEILWLLVTGNRYNRYMERFLPLISRKLCKEFALHSWQRVWNSFLWNSKGRSRRPSKDGSFHLR